jgi:excisionase family DNA binding protein
VLTKERPDSEKSEKSEKSQEKPLYLTVDEAAVRTHVSGPTIRRALKSGALIYRAARGTTKLLRSDEVDAWARSRSPLPQVNDIQQIDEEDKS